MMLRAQDLGTRSHQALLGHGAANAYRLSISKPVSVISCFQRWYRSPWVIVLGLFLFVTSSIAMAAIAPVDYVDPIIDTHAPRWDFFACASRPFGMVNLHPDMRVGSTWKTGYIYEAPKILDFSYIHAWQLWGIAVMPVCGSVHGNQGLVACASRYSHKEEVVRPGYYRVKLQKYGITVELTSTMRVGFTRYTFPKSKKAQILFNTGATLQGPVLTSEVRRDSDTELSGSVVMWGSPNNRRSKCCTVYFVAQFNKPFANFGGWSNRKMLPKGINQLSGAHAGAYVAFPTTTGEQVLMKLAISYTSIAGARRNLEAELPGWDFNRVVRQSRQTWNRRLSRITVAGGTKAQRIKFYTDLWHAMLGRTIVSDADGRYCDMTGPKPIIRRVPLNADGKPRYAIYNFDALWGTQWDLNLLWPLLCPDVMSGFCNTMVDMYRNGGLIPRGPSGNSYTYVMIGDQAAPFFAAAYSIGIRDFNVAEAYAGLRKNALPGGIRDHAGYEFDTNGDSMKYYINQGYVPENFEGSGLHKDGASMTLEYAYEDWCVAQLAIALGHNADARWLMSRSHNYTNVWNPKIDWEGWKGWMCPRLKNGSWLPGFEPVGPRSEEGFVEANSAIDTYDVPQDVPGLIRLFGNPNKFIARLNWQFYRGIPHGFVVEGGDASFAPFRTVDFENQPSLAMPYLFDIAGAPWLSQKWVRAVHKAVFSDTSPAGGYVGDEDEGQMGAYSALMAIGLFDVQGGAALHPTYQITAPIFKRITIHLDPHYFPGRTFTIIAHNSGPKNIYIQSAKLDGVPLNKCCFPQAELIKGGTLELVLGPRPNRWWGMDTFVNPIDYW